MNSDTIDGLGSPPTPEDEANRSTPDSARESLVRATGGGYTPVRRVFVQKHEKAADRSSTLGRLVRHRKRRELILYLMVLTRWDRPAWRSEAWLRALTLGKDATMTWSRTSLSETWTELVNLELVDRRRERRLSKITPRREDGKEKYERPDGGLVVDQYFSLPGEFWTEKLFDRLSLAGVAVLLILLRETNKKDEVPLTHAQTAEYYGISASTAKKGYAELAAASLLSVRSEWRRDDNSATGLAEKRWYSLTGAFSTHSREAARKAARKESAARRRRESRAAAKKATTAPAKKAPAKKAPAKKAARAPAKRKEASR